MAIAKLSEIISSTSTMNAELPLYDENKISRPDNPLVSIITVVFNDVHYLEKSIQSIINQTYRNIEYIIIDGGSTDGTVDIIKKYENRINYWVSEKDDGIYDAMNKGVSIAHGEWVLFIGSNDQMINNRVLDEYIDALFQSAILKPRLKPLLVYGDVIYSNGYYFKSTLNYYIYLHNTVHHQAALYNKILFNSFRYNTSCKYVADYELNLLVFIKNRSVLYINKPLSLCIYGGASSNLINRAQTIRELNKIRKMHINIFVHIGMCIILIIKTFIRTNILWK